MPVRSNAFSSSRISSSCLNSSIIAFVDDEASIAYRKLNPYSWLDQRYRDNAIPPRFNFRSSIRCCLFDQPLVCWTRKIGIVASSTTRDTNVDRVFMIDEISTGNFRVAQSVGRIRSNGSMSRRNAIRDTVDKIVR